MVKSFSRDWTSFLWQHKMGGRSLWSSVIVRYKYSGYKSLRLSAIFFFHSLFQRFLSVYGMINILQKTVSREFFGVYHNRNDSDIIQNNCRLGFTLSLPNMIQQQVVTLCICCNISRTINLIESFLPHVLRLVFGRPQIFSG